MRVSTKNQILITIFALLVTVLACVACARTERMERPKEPIDAAALIHPPVPETPTPWATPEPVTPPVFIADDATPRAAALLSPDITDTAAPITMAEITDTGAPLAEPEAMEEPSEVYGVDFTLSLVCDGPNMGSHFVRVNIENDVHITAYCSCEICCGYWATVRPVDEDGNEIVYTSTGAVAVQGVTVAVNPAFIPHGSYVYVQDPRSGAWREYRATDSSPEMNHVDIYYNDHAAAWNSGYGGYATVYWSAEPVDVGTLA